MKKIIIFTIFNLLINFTFLFAENSKSPTNKDYDEFIFIIEQVYKNGFDKPNRSIYKDIVHSFYDFIENNPNNKWSIAAFMQVAPIINGFHFDKDTSYEEILSFSKSLTFKSEYSKSIFTQIQTV